MCLDYDVSAVPIYYPGDVVKEIEKNVVKHKLDGDESGTISRENEEENTIAPPVDVFEKQTYTEEPITTTTFSRHHIVTTTPALVTKRPTRKRPDFGIKQEPICKLPINPNLDDIDVVKAGYRFGTTVNSRIEIKQIPSRMKKAYEISLEFKTESYEGVLFYAADPSHTDFVALYLKGGKVTLSSVNITSFKFDRFLIGSLYFPHWTKLG